MGGKSVAEGSALRSTAVLRLSLYVMPGYPASGRTFTITTIRIIVVPCETMVYRELVGFF